MFRGIKLKLGLIKLTENEITNLLYDLHNDLANRIIANRICDEDTINEQKSEILLFFWLLRGVPFLYNCKNLKFKEILDNNIFDILFRNLKDDYEADIIDSIYLQRRSFYNKMLKSNNGLEMQQILKEANNYLFKEPFEPFIEDKSISFFENDLIQGIKETTYISLLIEKALPSYTKSLKNLSRATKNE